MTKQITMTEAQDFISKHSAFASFDVGENANFVKVTSKLNKHRIYFQKSAYLGRIDTTLPVKGMPGTSDLKSPNGSISCHLVPDLETLDGFLAMLADPELGKQVPRKPRPFAPTKPPERSPVRTQLVAVVAPVPHLAVSSEEGGSANPNLPLAERLEAVRRGAEMARKRRATEELGIDEAVMEAVDRGDMDPDEVAAQHKRMARNRLAAELSEQGIEIPELGA